jgi:hypothetical protein
VQTEKVSGIWLFGRLVPDWRIETGKFGEIGRRKKVLS